MEPTTRGPLRRAEVAGQVVFLSTDGTVPYYVQIAQQLTYLIYSRLLQPGMPLPSVRALATALGVTSNTVSQAYSELQDTGLVVAVKGSGTYVRPDVFTQDDDWHVRNELAAEAVASARRRMHSLGLSDDDFQRHVMGVLHGPDRLCEVAFAAPTLPSARKFALGIEADLGHLGIRAVPVEFSQLADPTRATRALLERIYYFITFVSQRQTVTRLLEPFGARYRVVGVSIELVAETVESLRALDHDLTVLIVTTERYVDIALNVVQSNSRLDPKRIDRMTVDDGTSSIAERAEKADLVIHTFGASAEVEALGLPEDKRLPIDFKMDGPSKQYLADMLTSRGPS